MYDNLERKIALAMPSHLSMFRRLMKLLLHVTHFPKEEIYLEYLEGMHGCHVIGIMVALEGIFL
jgi:hypothetical protein